MRKDKKPFAVDSFLEFTLLKKLRGRGGRALWLARRGDREANRYNADLWLWQEGAPRRLTNSGEVADFWWLDDDAVAFTRSDEERPPLPPKTQLWRLELGDEGAQPTLWQTLNLALEDLVALEDGRLLALALWDPAWDGALARAGGDAEAAAKEMADEGAEATDQLPFWANGEGYTGNRRRRLFLWEEGAAKPLTDGFTEVELLTPQPDQNALWFVAKSWRDVVPDFDRLMRLDLATMESGDHSLSAAYAHQALVPLEGGGLLVYGTDMRRHGLNQNGSFTLLENDGTTHPLYDGGGYALGDGTACDLKASAQQRPALLSGEAFFSAASGGDAPIFALDLQSGAIRQLLQEAGTVQEVAACGGALLFTGMLEGGGQELYRLEKNGEARRLTDFNASVAASFAVAVPVPVPFTGAGGGALEGWLLPPAGFDAENPPGRAACPGLLCIHGGPKGAYGPGLFHEMQFLCAQGFAVFFCNPTGSDGGGDDFADLRGRYGSVDHDDLMAFTDAVLEQHPWIDPKRLGVSGGSYGGFMVNWMIGRSDRFAAAVSQRGIADWGSLRLTSDIGPAFVDDQIGESEEACAAASPLGQMGRVSTPTLFIHSGEDYRCPLSESLQMYSALKLQGVKARLCVFKGENHELSRSGRPAARIRRLREIAGWFERHLTT